MKVKGLEQQHLSQNGKVTVPSNKPGMAKCLHCERLVGVIGRPPKKCPHCGTRWKKRGKSQ